ncbi:glycoside hydrolase family 2 protein [Tenacibaculum halocynthiae]|uniref:glycoside hydrolase family 2 protein n=1 Tax=Tenacibaculum halocynthiae TaxID=1254437 RepID=UPI00389452F6
MDKPNTTIVTPKISSPIILNSTLVKWLAIKDDLPEKPSAIEIKEKGIQYTSVSYKPTNWIDAIIPGTTLNTLVHNSEWIKQNIPSKILSEQPGSTTFFNPYFDTNLLHIPDVNNKGITFYTYWYYTEIKLPEINDASHFWLKFRGINYTADIFINGKQLNKEQLKGMFFRNDFDISTFPSEDGVTRIAVRIVPPNPVGIPTLSNNGGIQGVPNIGENVTMRYPIGWDWMATIPDRSTGLWDQVSIETTKSLVLKNPHITTTVLENGILTNNAKVNISVEVYNSTNKIQIGTLKYVLNEKIEKLSIKIPPSTEAKKVTFPEIIISNPKLWWPHGCDPSGTDKLPELYDLDIYIYLGENISSETLSDQKKVRVGIREFSIKNDFKVDAPTSPSKRKSRKFFVNGNPIFIRGGNWMGTDALFRMGADRYRNEVRMHKEMNINLIRVWGGGIAERPEFYEACDEFGILVMQEFWFSSEFIYNNSNLPETYKKTFTKCAVDTIKMLRNHASLLFWCAANESIPPQELLVELKTYIGAKGSLDTQRILIENSKAISGQVENDGPYGIYNPDRYFKWLPDGFTGSFNPEIGSLGVPPVESMRLVLDENSLGDKTIPKRNAKTSDVLPSWQHLKYSQYFINSPSGTPLNDQIYTYGTPKNIEDFCERAQLASYFHYKELWEGYLTYMWQRYTGLIIWKSQGPWTGLRAKLYDWFLESTGGYWGVKNACEAIHVQLNLINYPNSSTFDINIVNHTVNKIQSNSIEWNVYSCSEMIGTGNISMESQLNKGIVAGSSTGLVYSLDLKTVLSKLKTDEKVYFLKLKMTTNKGITSENFYWLSTNGQFDELETYKNSIITCTANGIIAKKGSYKIQLTANNNGALVSFWNRLQVRKPVKKGMDIERVLPVFYDKNYFSMLGKSEENIEIEFEESTLTNSQKPELWLKGWNQTWQQIKVIWE